MAGLKGGSLASAFAAAAPRRAPSQTPHAKSCKDACGPASPLPFRLPHCHLLLHDELIDSLITTNYSVKVIPRCWPASDAWPRVLPSSSHPGSHEPHAPGLVLEGRIGISVPAPSVQHRPRSLEPNVSGVCANGRWVPPHPRSGRSSCKLCPGTPWRELLSGRRTERKVPAEGDPCYIRGKNASMAVSTTDCSDRCVYAPRRTSRRSGTAGLVTAAVDEIATIPILLLPVRIMYGYQLEVRRWPLGPVDSGKLHILSTPMTKGG